MKSTEDLSKRNISFQSRIMLSLVQTSKNITQSMKLMRDQKISRLQGTTNSTINSTFKKLVRNRRRLAEMKYQLSNENNAIIGPDIKDHCHHWSRHQRSSHKSIKLMRPKNFTTSIKEQQTVPLPQHYWKLVRKRRRLAEMKYQLSK